MVCAVSTLRYAGSSSSIVPKKCNVSYRSPEYNSLPYVSVSAEVLQRDFSPNKVNRIAKHRKDNTLHDHIRDNRSSTCHLATNMKGVR